MHCKIIVNIICFSGPPLGLCATKRFFACHRKICEICGVCGTNMLTMHLMFAMERKYILNPSFYVPYSPAL